METNSILLMESDKKNSLYYSNEGFISINASPIPSEEPNVFFTWSEIYNEEERALKLISEIEKKNQGIFFTPSQLVSQSVSKLLPINLSESYFDPACGTGNLLVEIAKSFDVDADLETTLTAWNNRLYGLDLEENFVNITKKKLIRLAIDKGSKPSKEAIIDSLMLLLSNIKVGNFIEEYKTFVGRIENVIMNPPFNKFDAPKSLSWSSGKLNAAALFLYYASEILPENGKLIGILPDVIRSGSRYSKLRAYLKNVLPYTFELYGEFKKKVQIDVFILQGIKQTSTSDNEEQSVESDSSKRTLNDCFDVSVGPVVPHRDKVTGVNAPYIHAKSLPAWGEISVIDERITHQGRKIKPPFIAIRRTSSPKDKTRVVATIVNCIEAVAVENHIIVVSPKDRNIDTCRDLLKYLVTKEVNEYINSQIRCRHLTVRVIKGLPLKKDSND